MRLARILSLAGIASRRKAEDLIREGAVSVNGHCVTNPAVKADPHVDRVVCDGKPIRPRALATRHYLVLNKPRGYVCTRRDERGRPTVMSLLPNRLQSLYPVGRLDIESEGMLLLTDDGDFCLKMTHPRYGIRKTYRARVRGVPDSAALQRLRRGVRVDGELLKAEEVALGKQAKNAWLTITLTEGRQNEVRRLLKAVGHPVVRLQRVSIDFLTLHGVPPGRHRALRADEVTRLMKTAAQPRRPRPRTSGPRRPSGDHHAEADHR